MSILLIIIVVLAWIIYCQHREISEQDRRLAKLDSLKEDLAKTKAELYQLKLLADYIRQEEVIGPKGSSIFSYVSAFHPLRQN